MALLNAVVSKNGTHGTVPARHKAGEDGPRPNGLAVDRTHCHHADDETNCDGKPVKYAIGKQRDESRYRHLVETAAVWKRLAQAKNTLLQDYRAILDHMIGHRSEDHDPDREHRKVQATARRALDFFKRGQKTLIFCVFTKTAETIRDQVQAEIDGYLNEVKSRVFGEGTTFENFRKRFFNRREPLFSLIQDHPLLGRLKGGVPVGIPTKLRLTENHLREVAQLLVDRGESASNEKPDRRLLLAATEHVAVKAWEDTTAGDEWISCVLAAWKDKQGWLQNPIADPIPLRHPSSDFARLDLVMTMQDLIHDKSG